MITENLSTLKLHKLSQKQYNREKDANNLEFGALYLTPDSVRYSTISDALAEINANENGNILTYTDDAGLFNIVLLNDIESNEQMNITRNCSICLNGHTLRLTAPGAHLNISNAQVNIDGEMPHSAIYKENLTGASNTTEYIVCASNSDVIVSGGSYIITNISVAKTASVFNATNGSMELYNCIVEASNSEVATYNDCIFGTNCSIKVNNCIITAKGSRCARCVYGSTSSILVKNSNIIGEANEYVYGIYEFYGVFDASTFAAKTLQADNTSIIVSSSVKKAEVYGIGGVFYDYTGSITLSDDNPVITIIINDCNVQALGFADTQKDDDEETDHVSVYAVQALRYMHLIINNGTYWGSREGVSAGCKTRIDGGMYGGGRHGGLYLQGPSAYIRNAVFSCTHARLYTDPLEEEHFGCVYCSGQYTSNAKYYFNNCQFIITYPYVSHCLVVKQSQAAVYLSNCDFIETMGTITSGQLRADYQNTIYIGENVKYASVAQPTNPDPNVASFAHGIIDTVTHKNVVFDFNTEDYLADFGSYDIDIYSENQSKNWTQMAAFGAQANRIVGDIDSALDSIIALQQELIGGTIV